MAQVQQLALQHVCVTGGEPLAQKACLTLLTRLCDAGYRVSLETSGALPFAEVDRRVVKVVDVKTPGSGEHERNLYEQLATLSPHDQLKFVLCDRADYDWSRQLLARLQRPAECTVWFSPSAEQLPAGQLAAMAHTTNTNMCAMSVTLAQPGLAIIMSSVDNLAKGAATQAIQCMNIMCGLNETEGLQ